MKNTIIKLFIGLVLFATLVALTVFDVPNAARLVDLCYAALIGLGITHLSDSGESPQTPDRQGGFAHPALLALVAVGGLLLMSGCASVQQGVQAYGAIAVTGARAANDTVIEAQKVSFCALPYSALQRHPEIQPAVQTLCGPLGATAAAPK